MSGVRITRDMSLYLEMRAECQVCGCSLHSECKSEQQGSPIVVRVAPCRVCSGSKREDNKGGK